MNPSQTFSKKTSINSKIEQLTLEELEAIRGGNTWSNLQKALHDTAMAVIRKVGG